MNDIVHQQTFRALRNTKKNTKKKYNQMNRENIIVEETFN